MSINLTEDGGISKTILKEGTGEKPVDKANVKVHYVGRLDDGTVFDSSRERDDPFGFQLGVGQVIKGWDVGIASMRVGELANLRCTSAYAYGDRAQNKIPANSTLTFEVEMLSWEPAPKSRSDMSTDELIDGSTKDKDAGNELFKRGDFAGAKRKYADGLTWHKHVYQDVERAKPLEVTLLINTAACDLKLDHFSGLSLVCAFAFFSSSSSSSCLLLAPSRAPNSASRALIGKNAQTRSRTAPKHSKSTRRTSRRCRAGRKRKSANVNPRLSLCPVNVDSSLALSHDDSGIRRGQEGSRRGNQARALKQDAARRLRRTAEKSRAISRRSAFYPLGSRLGTIDASADEKRRFGNLFAKTGGGLYDDKPSVPVFKGKLPKVRLVC